MEKVDRRVRRTRALLEEALRGLILQKPYDAITIQDITDEADLNRATFYLHYANKEELLMGSLEAQFDELVQRMEAGKGGKMPWDDPAAARILFEYAAENAALFTVLLGQNGQGYVMHRIIAYIARYDQQFLCQAYDENTLAVPAPLLAQHFAGSLFALTLWWLENGMPYSAQYMAETMQRLCVLGMAPVMEAAALRSGSEG